MSSGISANHTISINFKKITVSDPRSGRFGLMKFKTNISVILYFPRPGRCGLEPHHRCQFRIFRCIL